MLIVLLRLLTFSVLTLWSFLTRLIFSSIAYLIVFLIQGFKFPGEAVQGGFQVVADVIRWCFESLISLVVESVSFMVTTVFDTVFNIVKDSVTGSVNFFGDVIGTLLEKTKTSLEESVDYVAEMSGEISEMVTNMVAELWNSYEEAVGYVKENIG